MITSRRALKLLVSASLCALILRASPAGAAHQTFSIRAEAGQFLAVPLGERTFSAGNQVRVTAQKGVLKGTRILSACGPATTHPEHPGRIAGFGPKLTMGNDKNPLSSVVGKSSSAPGLVLVTTPPPELNSRQIAAIEQNGAPHAPAVQLGHAEHDDASSAGVGWFSWVEVEVDTTGLPQSTLVILKLEEFPRGTSLSAAPAKTDFVPAALINR